MRANESRRGDPYDVVYCVYDRDEHAHFNTASHEARAVNIRVARSWPCFEFWLILHFTYHRKPYAQSHNRTASENCLKELQRYLPSYDKGALGVFGAVEGCLEKAKLNAVRVMTDVSATGSLNPSTEVHLLVSYLQRVKTGV